MTDLPGVRLSGHADIADGTPRSAVGRVPRPASALLGQAREVVPLTTTPPVDGVVGNPTETPDVM